MKKIIIVGAGGFGREIAGWLEHVVPIQAISIAGYLDDTMEANSQKAKRLPYPILGSIKDYKPGNDEYLVIAIGEPNGKFRVAQSLKARGAKFFNMIHPTAVVAQSAKIGEGIILCPFSLVSSDTQIGDFVTINVSSSIGHDAIVGDGSTLSSHNDLTAGVELGKCVFMGTSASVVPGVKIGSGAKIGAGAIVVRDVQDNSTVYAAPARTLRI